ncbi:uncharacterized protein LTR77_005218 [Saxophila tyrrhenica]|uniref:Uncharacterized protein n=1 Tax=Saxophila tyrrhenica TaxID=1690608 RepID=A0AAV9PDS7_9PEZI|nr:hypothetical protein LTR77_005218 [Saxophila tyrrhenica]
MVLFFGLPTRGRGGPRGDFAPKQSTLLDTSFRPSRVFIAGYRDLTREEFAAHYHDRIKKAIENGSSFILSDEPGTCSMAFEYLKSKKDVPRDDITIYRSTADGDEGVKGLPSSKAGKCRVVTVPGGEAERLVAMSEASDAEIVWLYGGDTLGDYGCSSAGDILDMWFRGPKEVVRLGLAKSVGGQETLNL